jgi:hypothetical protein
MSPSAYTRFPIPVLTFITGTRSAQSWGCELRLVGASWRICALSGCVINQAVEPGEALGHQGGHSPRHHDIRVWLDQLPARSGGQ